MINEKFMKVGKVVVGDSTLVTRTNPNESCNFTISNGKYKYEFEETVCEKVLRRTELSIVVDEEALTSRDTLKVITCENNPVHDNGVFFSIRVDHYSPFNPIGYYINCSLDKITVRSSRSNDIIFEGDLSEDSLNKAFDETLGLVVNVLPISDETIGEIRNIFWNNFPFIIELFNESFEVPVHFYETGSVELGEKLKNIIIRGSEWIKKLDSRLNNNELSEDDYNKEKSKVINATNIEINNVSILLEQLRLFVEQQANKGKGTK